MAIPAPSLQLYGIPNCDTVKKARTWLNDQAIATHFHDFKKDGLDAATVLSWAQHLPWEQLLNRRGTTWRKLPPDVQASAVDAESAAQLMALHPSLVKRPVVVWPNGHITVGFDANAWSERASALPPLAH